MRAAHSNDEIGWSSVSLPAHAYARARLHVSLEYHAAPRDDLDDLYLSNFICTAAVIIVANIVFNDLTPRRHCVQSGDTDRIVVK